MLAFRKHELPARRGGFPLVTPTRGQTVSHYRLIEKIGEGGMGVVWKAEDTILGRTVALKVLPAEAALDETRRRMFIEEARLASSLSDGHIAQVHELGHHEGLDFIVMELVDGKSLYSIARGRALPVGQVVHLGRQIAQALSRAHHKGLLHRDLKPANILVTPDGDAKVVDFGLATLFAPQETGQVSDLPTRTETIAPAPAATPGAMEHQPRRVGTLPYMSPEQTLGQPLDARSDIFSLGIILYELATGRRPFAGDSPVELLKDIQRGRPRQPHDRVPKLPIDLDRIIMKALAGNRSERYQTMDDLAVDLKRLARDLESGSSPSFEDLAAATAHGRRRSIKPRTVVSVVALAVLAVAGWLALGRRGAAGDARTVLVVPFEVRGEGENAAFVGLAFAEGVAVNLAQVESLKVLPVLDLAAAPDAGGDGPAASSSEVFLAAARRAGAGRLLSGSLTRAGDRIEVSATLIDVDRNRLLWGTQEATERETLSERAASFARQVQSILGVSARRMHDSPFAFTSHPGLAKSDTYIDAFTAVKKHANALEATARLVSEFPGEVDAWLLRLAALAAAAQELPPGSPERVALGKAMDELRRLDPESPWLEALHGDNEANDGQRDVAMRRYDGLLRRPDITPQGRAFVLARRAELHSYLGDNEAALADLGEASRVAPAEGQLQKYYAFAFVRSRRYEEALAAQRRGEAIAGRDHNDRVLGWILYKMGRWREASDALEPFCSGEGDSWSCAEMAVALHLDGRADEAKDAAARAAALKESRTTPCALAGYHAVAGERDLALTLLRRCIEQGNADTRWDLQDYREDRSFQSLHDDPQFQEILARAESRLSRR